MTDEPFSQAEHDELAEGFARDVLLGVGIVVGVVIILIFG